jgi:dTMP kinase
METAGGGVLVAIEGIDGSGKTTLVQGLAARLRASGAVPVVCSREPTDGPHGRALRATALSGRRPPGEELELLLADRRQHVAEVIGPALAAGAIVLLDRYYYSTAAYQGAAGLDVAELLALNRAFAPRPDLLLVVDVEPERGLSRVAGRGDGANHFEIPETLRRARAIFLELAATEGGLVLDGRAGATEVLAAALQAVERAAAYRMRA